VLASGLKESDRLVPTRQTRKPARKSSTRKSGSGKASARKAGAKKTSARKPTGGARRRGGSGRRRGRGRRRTISSVIGSALRRVVYWTVVLVVITGGLGATVAGYYATRLPAADSWAVPARAANVRVLAANGSLISNRADTAGVRLSLEEMSPYLPEAVIAIEDRRFYWHFGLDPIGLARAVLANWRAGRIVQGGSTLTQQLAKNLFLKPDRTIARKAQEVVLAFWLEAKLSKREILELYLNRVYMGAGAYGVDAAAHRYFGKSARHVSLAEAATLAGLLKAPATYSPVTNAERSAGRAAIVVMAMHDAGFIDARQASLALSAPIGAVSDVAGGSGRYVVDWVLDRLPGYVGTPGEDIVVDTSIDLRLQDAAARTIAATLAESGVTRHVDQGALVALDVNGAVRAMVGGRSYATSPYNRAVSARRQPGSAFKPFVYLTALEYGLVPESVRVDQPISIGDWRPENYAKKYHGAVTLRTALALSLNTVSAQLTYEFGPSAVAATARRLGIASPLMETPSIALGTSEVSPLELTAAYVPFSNGGRGVIPHVIARITTAAGEVLYERSGSGPGQIIDPVQVGMMNAMLADTLIRGTGRRAQLAGWPAAGKTGTSQDFRDAWFVGYTGVLTAGVWFGNDNGEPTDRVTGGNLPAIAWQQFMTEAHAGLAVTSLPGKYQTDLTVTAVEADRAVVPANAIAAGGQPMEISPVPRVQPVREIAAAPFDTTGAQGVLLPPADVGARPRRLDRGGLLRRLFGG
ncbi:MAG: transglycosylase domain-containing protein, partial [Alphaproteobacteria bacterium]